MRRECEEFGMKKRHRISTVILLVLAALLITLSGCSMNVEAKDTKDTLKVGVRDDIVGLGFLNKVTKQYYGLEIDIAKALAEDLGYKDLKFVTVKPENRKEKLMNGDVDCLIAAYSVADTRKKNFDFSKPYYVDQIKVMVEKSSMIDSVEGLKGKRIGVLDGANAAPLYAIKMKELGLLEDMDEGTSKTVVEDGGVILERMKSYSDLSVALEEGRVDAACMDGSIAETYVDEDRQYIDVVIEEQDYAVATQKGSGLSKEVDKSIKKMLDDGTIEKLIDKWN